MLRAAKEKKPDASVAGGFKDIRIFVPKHLTKFALDLRMKAKRELD